MIIDAVLHARAVAKIKPLVGRRKQLEQVSRLLSRSQWSSGVHQPAHTPLRESCCVFCDIREASFYKKEAGFVSWEAGNEDFGMKT